MDIATHKQKFDEVIKRYDLAEKAEEIANYLTRHKEINSSEFANLFAMDDADARIFLSFIRKGIEFREKHLRND